MSDNMLALTIALSGCTLALVLSLALNCSRLVQGLREIRDALKRGNDAQKS